VQAGYEVRLYDLSANRLEPKPLKDPHESAVIAGAPWARVSSAGGRYLFTLYIEGTGGAMVHELDLQSLTARCIDLPGHGDANGAAGYALVPDPDGRTLWAVSPTYGRVAAIDIAAARVRVTYRRRFGSTSGGGLAASVAVMSPDGERIAVSEDAQVWLVGLAQEQVLRRISHVAVALGFAPDNSKLWAVGEGSRVVALPSV